LRSPAVLSACRSLPILLVGISVGAALALPAAGAERRAASDFHRRALVDGGVAAGEAYAVPLSAEVVSALRDGGELRLFDAAGSEIPSLVHTAVSRGEVTDRPVTIFNQGWREDGTRTVSVEVDERKTGSVNEFVLEIADEQYNARVRVEGSADGAHWQILRDGLHLIRHRVTGEEIDYLHNVLRVPTARFRFYRFTLNPTSTTPVRDEGDDSGEGPLEVTAVSVREVVERGSTLALPVALERVEDERDDDSRHHYWKLDLGREKLGVDRVDLAIPATDYARTASLWEWSPERNRRTRRLATTVLFHYASEAGDDEQTRFSGFATDARELVLRIDQGDDAPVDVSSVRASRPWQQVRFLAPTATQLPIGLYVEPDAPRTPRYDLARRLREHEIESFTELAAGPLGQNPGYAEAPEPASEQVPYLLYVLVVPMIVGLGVYVVRTIQRGMPAESQGEESDTAAAAQAERQPE
jgi:hypothetical protein